MKLKPLLTFLLILGIMFPVGLKAEDQDYNMISQTEFKSYQLVDSRYVDDDVLKRGFYIYKTPNGILMKYFVFAKEDKRTVTPRPIMHILEKYYVINLQTKVLASVEYYTHVFNNKKTFVNANIYAISDELASFLEKNYNKINLGNLETYNTIKFTERLKERREQPFSFYDLANLENYFLQYLTKSVAQMRTDTNIAILPDNWNAPGREKELAKIPKYYPSFKKIEEFKNNNTSDEEKRNVIKQFITEVLNNPIKYRVYLNKVQYKNIMLLE